MREIKKVAILDNKIVHIYHSEEELNEFIIENATIEEREMEYDVDRGWYEVGTKSQQTLEDYLLDLDFRLSLVEIGLV